MKDIQKFQRAKNLNDVVCIRFESINGHRRIIKSTTLIQSQAFIPVLQYLLPTHKTTTLATPNPKIANHIQTQPTNSKIDILHKIQLQNLTSIKTLQLLNPKHQPKQKK